MQHLCVLTLCDTVDSRYNAPGYNAVADIKLFFHGTDWMPILCVHFSVVIALPHITLFGYNAHYFMPRELYKTCRMTLVTTLFTLDRGQECRKILACIAHTCAARCFHCTAGHVHTLKTRSQLGNAMHRLDTMRRATWVYITVASVEL